jgi:tetratricopeptide (TPR) repeat protein
VRDRELALPLALCIALAAALCYVPALGGEFVWDDQFYITGNPHVHELNGETVRWAFGQSYAGNWHPLTWISHAVDVAVFGLQPRGHHVVNVACHAANSTLLLLALLRLTGSLWGAGAVAALFALHPVQVESVAWIAERKNVLSTFFFLLAIHAYISHARRPRLTTYGLLLSAFACGLASKPMVVTLPVVLLLLDRWPLQRRGAAALLEKLPLFAMSAASAIVTLVSGWQATTSLAVIGPGMRVANALVSYARYVLHVFFPSGLSPYYPYLEQERGLWVTIGAAALIFAITGAALAFARTRPYLLVGWLFFLVTLLPVIGLVQVGRQAMADRYAYIPSIGLLLAAVWLLGDWVGPQEARWRALSGRARLATLAVVGLCLVLGILTWRQASIWHDAESLWRYALRFAPRSSMVHFNLANALSKRGALEEAVQEFTRAIEVETDTPQRAGPHHRIGLIRRSQNRLEESLGELSEAVRLQPDNPTHRAARAGTLYTMGRLDEAEQEYLRALALPPLLPPEQAGIHRNYAVLLLRKQRVAEAIEHGRRAVALAGNPANYEALAFSYAQAGRRQDAIAALRRGLAANPGNALLAGRLRQLELQP